MEIKLNIKERVVLHKLVPLPAQSRETIKVVFEWEDAEWNDYSKTVVFNTLLPDGNSVITEKIYLSTGTTLPQENLVKSGKLFVTLVGRASSGALIATTYMPEPIRVADIGTVSGTSPASVTPSILDQVLEAAGSAADEAVAAAQSASDAAQSASDAEASARNASSYERKAYAYTISAEYYSDEAKRAQDQTLEYLNSANSLVTDLSEYTTEFATEMDRIKNEANTAAANASTSASAAASAARRAEEAADASEHYHDLVRDEETGRVHVTVDGEPQGDGLELEEGGGVGFDDWGTTAGTGGTYLHLYDADGNDVKDPVFIPGGGGGGSGSTLRLLNKLPSRSFSVITGTKTANIEFTATSVDSQDSTVELDMTASIAIGGSTVLSGLAIEQGDNTINVADYLAGGTTNNVTLTVEDAYGATRSLQYKITAVSYGLTWNLEEFGVHGTDELAIRLTPTGSGEKTLHIAIDGTEQDLSTINPISSSGRALTYRVAAQSHGDHVITAWLSTTVDGETVTTTPLRYIGIWTQRGVTLPIIGVYETEFTVPQLQTHPLKWFAYNPESQNTLVTLSENDNLVRSVTVGRTVQTWNYRSKNPATNTLTLRCGAAVKTVTATVTGIGYDIEPTTDGLALDLDPNGHSNTETDRAQFGYTDRNGVNHPLILSSNFDWTNGGFQQDEKGNAAFVVRRGCTASLDRSFFDDTAPNGKSIEIIFKSTNVRDYDAALMHCYANNIGLRFNAQNAYFSSDTTTLEAKYCEDRIVEFAADFESANEHRLMAIWEAGTTAKKKAYDQNAVWLQATPDLFTIGSADADVWIYRIKQYDTHLSKNEILANFVADAPDPEDIIRRYLANDILTDDGSQISIPKLIQAAPDLHVIQISSDGFPKDKKNGVACDIEHWLGNPESEAGRYHHWRAMQLLSLFVLQGTSSMNYIEGRPNIDIDMTNAVIVNGNGDTLTDGYSMTENSIPVKYFNLKCNEASSENANNACSAEWFNRYNPFKSLAQVLDPRVRGSVEGHPCAVFFTNTGSEAIRLGSDKAQLVQPNETILLFAGDMNNSKKNFPVFGHTDAVGTDGDGIGVFCVEFMDNGYERCLFQSADFSQETWKNVAENTYGQFEFRYPKNPTTAMKNKFIAMQNWVCSTNPAQATGAQLSPIRTLYNPWTRQDETFYQDTELYRKCKFRAEVGNWFHTDSLFYHYLFTEFFLGVDQRCKNMFVTYEPDENGVWKFSLRNYYDGDTIFGSNNKGAMTLTYGLDDTDTVEAGYVFNGHTSVLWCNVRDACFDQLDTLWSTLETRGCWDANAIGTFFDAYQRIRPEALMAEDYYVKYERSYIENGTATYLEDMLQGEKHGQRWQFLTYQGAYMASKHQATSAKNNSILLNTYAPENAPGVPAGSYFYITPYCDLYLTAQFDNFGTVSVRAKKGQETLVALKDGSGNYVKLNDTATKIYSSPWISGIRSMAQVYTQMFSAPNAPKLRNVVLGSGETGYENGNLTSASFAGMPLVEYIDLRGLVALASAVDLSGCAFLETFLATNSAITGVTFADGANVRTVALPSVNSLVALNLAHVENFTMGTDNIALLRVEGSPGVDTQSIVGAATTIQYGRIIGIDWHLAVPDPINRLIGKRGIDAQGNIDGTLVLIGDVLIDVLTQGELNAITAAFPELNVTYGSIVAGHTVTFQSEGGETLYTEMVRDGGTAIEPVSAGYISAPTKEPTTDYTYAFSGWSQSLSNITDDLTVTPTFSQQTRRYTVRFYAGDTTASSVLQSTTVAAHGSVRYNGAALTPPTGKVWGGWQTLTTDVTSDLDVFPWFIQKTAPAMYPEPGAHTYLYSDDPEDDSAYTFEEFWYICDTLDSNGDPLARSHFQIGDRIKIMCNTTAFSDVLIVLQLEAFKHFRNGERTGWTNTFWGMIGLMNSTHTMRGSATNVGGYNGKTSSTEVTMASWLDKTVFGGLPLHWQAVIGDTSVPSSAGNKSSEIVYSTHKLFLRSYAEMFGSTAVPYKDEVEYDGTSEGADQRQFQLYGSANLRIKKTYNGTGTAQSWWLRSPDSGSASAYRTVGSNGTDYSTSATGAYYVSFGFTIGAKTAA